MRAINSALKPKGRHCFYVIATRHGLTDADRTHLALRDGNDYVESPEPYDTMMTKAGFVDVEMIDVTTQYLSTLRAWKREWLAEADALVELLGEEEFKRRITNRTYDIEHVEAGLNLRFRCFGIKP